MDFRGLFVLLVAFGFAVKAQRNGLIQRKRPLDARYQYATNYNGFQNLAKRYNPYRENLLFKQPQRRFNDVQDNSKRRFTGNYDYRSIGYENVMRLRYPQSPVRRPSPFYGPSVGYKTGYPLPGAFQRYGSNYAPLPLSAPSLYGYGGYHVDKWGDWSSWSPCSRSCDSGVQERTRKCKGSKLAMTLSLYKGQGHKQGNCPGFGKEFQPCNTSPCVSVKSYEDQKYEARQSQCEKFNDQDYLGQRYKWLPYIRDGLNECRLYCLAKGFRMFVELAEKVNEGTPCGKNGIEACYNGTCSTKKTKQEAKTNESAGSITDNGNRKQEASQLPIVDDLTRVEEDHTFRGQLPGRIFKPTNSRNRLQSFRNAAVYSSEPQSQGLQQFIVPRVNKKIPSRFFNRHRAKPRRLVSKKVSGMFNSKVGLKLGYNPIFKIPVGASNILVQEARPSQNYLALKVGDKYLVNGHWSIVLKKDISAAGTLIKYRLNKGPKSTEIISAAGPTTKELQIVLLFQDGPPEVFFNYTIKLPESKESWRRKPVVTNNGNNRARTAPTLHWSIAGWTKCTQPCGGGEQKLNIRCVAVYPGQKTTVVRNSYCHTLKKPTQRKRACNLRPCKPSWVLLPWKPCSKTCGRGGYQQREVQCMRIIRTDHGKVEINAPFYECGRRPAIHKECPYVPCYNWKTYPWSSCSRSCDKGSQSRKVLCEANDQIKEDSLCDGQIKPETQRMCNLRPCHVTWFTGKWGKCSRICGEGRQTRLVFCAGKDGSALGDSSCKEEKPKESKVCKNQECNAIWLASNWTECSSSCGRSERSRIVLCFALKNGSMHQIADGLCDPNTKPKSKEICNVAPCQPDWFTTEWSQCSKTCGRGIRTRKMNCMQEDGKQGRGCQIETMPSAAEVCEMKPCENRIDNDFGSPSASKTVKIEPLRSNIYASTTKPPVSSDSSAASLDRQTQSKVQKGYAHQQTSRPFPDSSVSLTERGGKNLGPSETKTSRASSTTDRNNPTTTSRTTPKVAENPTIVPTTPKRTSKPECKNTFKQAYCAVISRIGFCKFTLYRNRCCAACEGR